MSFSINTNQYESFIKYLKIAEQDFDLSGSGYLYIYNNKVDSNLILNLPTGSNYIGVNLTIKNPVFGFQVLSSDSNVKQFDGSISNLICTSDNFSSIVYDGTYWLLCMTN